MPAAQLRHTVSVRWDDLFDDLAGQFDAEREAEQRLAQIEDERMRTARLTVRDRLAALERALTPNETIAILLDSGDRLEVTPTEFGADWFAATREVLAGARETIIVPIAGISAVLLTERQRARSLDQNKEHPASIAAKLGLAIPLRDLARRRLSVECITLMGQCFGTIDHVGRDHFDLAVHDLDQPRRRSSVRVHRLIPFTQLQLIRTTNR